MPVVTFSSICRPEPRRWLLGAGAREVRLRVCRRLPARPSPGRGGHSDFAMMAFMISLVPPAMRFKRTSA